MSGSLIQQRNDKVYLVSPLKVFTPTEDEISSFQFAKVAQQNAPNDKILWLSGEYVEGDVPNKNGQMWSSDDVLIKSVTANLMPITEMHDFRTAVGVIADTRLERVENSDFGSRVKLHTVLAVWAHRFPEVAQEILINYERGTLMQSQECESRAYECSACGEVFVKPVDEQAHCEHLRNSEAARRLLDVTFTGVGLIYGTRGSEGANPNAYLDLAMQEVANWSDARNGGQPKEKRTVSDITIQRSEYDDLKARPTAADLEAVQKELAEEKEARTAAEKALDEAEVARKAAEDAKEATDKELSEIKEKQEADEQAASRMKEISDELAEALPDTVKARVERQAREMSDEQWAERIEELSELVSTEKVDGGDGTFTKDEISRFNGAGRKGAGPDKIDAGELGRSLYKALN